jgi:hypothetical protein
MQEQLPLRPAEFIKIRDGFISFLRQPAGTSLQAIIPVDVPDAMALAARRGRKRRWWHMAMSQSSSEVTVQPSGGTCSDDPSGFRSPEFSRPDPRL